MSRLYACPVIGTGGELDPQRALIRDLAGVTRCRAVISVETSGATRGKPRHPWALCYVEASDWTAVEASGDCHHLTGEVLDGPISSSLRNRLANAGVATRAEINALATVRDLVAFLLNKHYAGVTFAEAFPEIAS